MFTRIALIGLLTYSVLPAQDIDNQPRVIADAKLAACVSHIGQNMVQNGAAEVPLTIKLEVSDEIPSGQQAKSIADPVTAACVDVLARNLVRNGAARVPFVLKATQPR
jgi:hypothetical protein